ncbi:SMI1/KNR4 family protein [Acidovorax sp. 62]|uniref:SMI1/KNR4 family protein n=1 Tax=Acidovorax sp. 62 TaxID=2035203 RepID=UPI0013042B67|nr:SMI1/KNR4 family protein [Acidovorax sp. 62]
MSEIERILLNGKSARDDEVKPVPPNELRALEELLRFTLPPSYCEFVALGGLGELRINHRVLNPQEVIESIRYVDGSQYVPFADNGCGDLYCWPRSGEEEPMVVFADHETDEYSQDAKSFAEWLAKNRF